jgi:hypothetical protein
LVKKLRGDQKSSYMSLRLYCPRHWKVGPRVPNNERGEASWRKNNSPDAVPHAWEQVFDESLLLSNLHFARGMTAEILGQKYLCFDRSICQRRESRHYSSTLLYNQRECRVGYLISVRGSLLVCLARQVRDADDRSSCQLHTCFKEEDGSLEREAQ